MSKKSSTAHACAFTFADGRHCRMPRHPPKAMFCLYHDRKISRLINSGKVGDDVFDPISSGFVPANALTQSLSRVIGPVADGSLSPKAATAISRVADTLLKSLALSTQEFREAYVHNYFAQLVRNSFDDLPDYQPPPPPITRPAPLPTNKPRDSDSPTAADTPTKH